MSGGGPTAGKIFREFLKLGMTAFGGPAIIAHIRELAVRRYPWVDNGTFTDGVVLSQSIPGATAMQVAAYVGLKTRGVPGALAAYGGLGLPAFFLMLLLSAFYAASRTVQPVLAVFGGLQVIVVAIVLHAAFSFGKDICRDPRGGALGALSAAALFAGVSPFAVIVAAAAAGILLFRDLPPGAAASGRTPAVPAALLAAGGVGGGIALGLLFFLNERLFGLAVLMLRINLFAFGGGLSSLPLMHHEIVARGWMESRTFLDGIALGQVTPGPISITGTFIGYLLFGVGGAVIATVATFTPSFVLLVVTAPYFERLKGSRTFTMATKGIAACFVGLLFYVAWRFARDVEWDPARLLLCGAAVAALWRKTGILVIVAVGALFSVIFL